MHRLRKAAAFFFSLFLNLFFFSSMKSQFLNVIFLSGSIRVIFYLLFLCAVCSLLCLFDCSCLKKPASLTF